MDDLLGRSGRYKAKNKKPAPKSKNAKKNKSDGPTCSMFLSELTRKLASKRREEQYREFQEETEAQNNIIHTIISSLTNALPVVFSKKSPDRLAPVQVETLAPELLPNDTLEVLVLPPQDDASVMEIDEPTPQSPQKKNKGYKMPKMPLTSSDVMKLPAKREPVVMEDVAVNTGNERDVAAELAKHVDTLKKISDIAEQFNQKTAKNLKEIVDSVQSDLMKKLEEVQAEQKAAERSNVIANKLMRDVEGSVEG